MLELTDNATEVIRTIVDSSEMPAGAGLRVAGPQNGQDGLTISTASTPQEGDHVVESDGARVFVEPTAAVLLGDSALDVRIDDDGAVQFLLTSSGAEGAGAG